MSAVLRIEAKTGEVADHQGDLAIIHKFKGEEKIGGPVGAALAARLAEIGRADRFEGRAGRHLLWHATADDGLRCRRYLLLGLGRRDDLTLDAYRRYLGDALVEADRLGSEKVVVPLVEGGRTPVAAREAATALPEGVLLGTYRFDGAGIGESAGAPPSHAGAARWERRRNSPRATSQARGPRRARVAMAPRPGGVRQAISVGISSRPGGLTGGPPRPGGRLPWLRRIGLPPPGRTRQPP